jgi:AraC family transcriptional regulator, transcriptional activator of pobA
MSNLLPKISFKSSTQLDIEVMKLEDTYSKLHNIKTHNPFIPHKIQFYFIVIGNLFFLNFILLWQTNEKLVEKNYIENFLTNVKFNRI